MKIAVVGPADIRPFAEVLGVPADLLPSGLGGSPVVEEVLELVRRNADVTLVTLSPDVTERRFFTADRLTVAVGPYREQPRARALDLFRKERSEVRGLLADVAADVVHAHWTYEFALGALSSGLPTLVTAHDAPWNVLKLDRSAYRQVRTALAVATARRAPLMTAVSPHVAEHWKRWLRVPRPPVVIPNPVSAMSAPVQKDGGYGNRFAYVANGFSRLKNGRVLLEAFTIHHARFPDSRLSLVGAEYGPGEPASVHATEKGLGGGVEFHGLMARTDVLEFMRNSVDVLVHASREECCCMTIAEAGTLGVTVIGGRRAGGVPWQLAGGAGLLVDVTSAEDIAAAMSRLAADSGLRTELAEQGRRRADMYRPDRVVGQYLHELEALC